MKQTFFTITYILVMNVIAALLWFHVMGKEKLNNLNITLIIIFGIFTTLVFGEIVLKKSDNGQEKD